MNETVERLYLTSLTVETRSDDQGGGKFFVGEGIVFGKPSRPLYDPKRGAFSEIIEAGAIDDNTDMSEVLAVFNHDENRLLGANYSGTLTFEITETGVSVRILKPENSVGDDCEVWVNRGDIRGMSFKFKVAKFRWVTEDGVLYRYVEKISTLLDLSLVTRAAYLQTSIGMAAQTRSFSEDAQDAVTRMFADKAVTLGDGDQKFLSDLVTQLKSQVDFIAGAIPALTDARVKRLAANRLSDVLYSQSWMEEILAELQAPAEKETPEEPADAERGATVDGTEQTATVENPAEQRGIDPETTPEANVDPLAYYRAKNKVHQNSLI